MNYTNEQIRGAIYAAADHIDRNPSEWNWRGLYIGGCGTPACALGWIGAFAGMPMVTKHSDYYSAPTSISFVENVLGIPNGVFYDRMREIHGNWREVHANIAPSLRAYADKYFPAVASQIVPEYHQLVPWSSCAWKPTQVRA